MTDDVYSAPKSDLNISKPLVDAEVWNPDVAGAWSLLFTPLFGSIIVYKNWLSLGEIERANKSKKWIYISVFMAIVSALIGLIGLVYICTWYYMSQKPQTLFLKSEYNNVYKKKRWGQPLLIAVGSWFAFIFVVGIILFVAFDLN